MKDEEGAATEEQQKIIIQGTQGLSGNLMHCDGKFTKAGVPVSCVVQSDVIIGDLLCVVWSTGSKALKLEEV
jgi:hypothetical protein